MRQRGFFDVRAHTQKTFLPILVLLHRTDDSMCVCVRERDIERERERETERQRDRERHRERQRDTHKETERGPLDRRMLSSSSRVLL